MPDGSDVEAERNRLPIAMACTDVMTRTVQVPAPVFAAVHAVCEDRILVELTATIAADNMVSRFLEALQIHSHDDAG